MVNPKFFEEGGFGIFFFKNPSKLKNFLKKAAPKPPPPPPEYS